jgi:tungstate transport system ATP-binding protein
MAGIMSADMGEIYYQNSIFPAKKRHLLTADSIYLASKAYLFDCSVERNITYPLHFKKSKKHQNSVEEVLRWANLTHLRDKHPDNLSSGEIQRVAIARAKIINPKIWLLDEPTENLDQDIKQKFYQLLRQLLEKGHSIVKQICFTG